MCQLCENIKVTDPSTSLTTKSMYKISYSFDCNDKSLIVEHVVNDIQVKLPNILGGGTIINLNLEKLRALTWNIFSKNLKSRLLEPDQKGFLKDVEARLIDKIQRSDPSKREFYWMRTLKTLHPDGLNIESDYQ